MSVDATRLQDFCQFGLISISGPFQVSQVHFTASQRPNDLFKITLAFISLYNMLGWPAFVGVAIMLFSVPLNTCKCTHQSKNHTFDAPDSSHCSYPETHARNTNEEP